MQMNQLQEIPKELLNLKIEELILDGNLIGRQRLI